MNSLNLFVKALIISFALYVSHVLLILLIGLLYQEQEGMTYGILGASVYIFLVAFWAYYIFCLLYLLMGRSIRKFSVKLLLALVMMSMAYLLYRSGDIMDGDFIERFRITPFAGFMVSGVLIVTFDTLVVRYMQRKN